MTSAPVLDTADAPSHNRHMNIFRDAFWVAVLGLVACFVFFFALGAVTTDAVGLILVMCGLGLLYAGHAFLAARRHADRDPRLTSARERRGF